MRLIDADELVIVTDGEHEFFERFEIESAPTIDPVNRGKWKYPHNIMWKYPMCSVCGKEVPQAREYSYCPYCGADNRIRASEIEIE